jgi:hypothetical protein
MSAYQGALGLARIAGIVSPDYAVLRPTSRVHDRYLAYLMLSTWFIFRMTERLRGIGSANSASVRTPRVNMEELADIELTLPKIEAQRQIADFLDDQVTRIVNIIAARTAQAGLFQECTTSELMQVVFSGHARSVPLANLAEVRLGRQRSPQSESGDYMTRYLRSANVVDGEIDLTDVKEMNFEPAARAIFLLRPGDVLVTEGAGSPDAVGASAVWDGREDGLCFQNTLVRLRPRTSEVAHDYLGWWARTSHRSGAMRTWATGANILHIGAEGLKRMPIPAVDWPAQQAVVRQCEEIDTASRRLAGALETSVERLAELKRSLITAAVTGEFDVSSADGSQVPV